MRKISIIAGVAVVTIIASLSFLATHRGNANKSDDIITTITPVNANGSDLIGGTWRYMPGTVHQADGVHIHPTDFRIVNQDGSGGQPNPAANLMGEQLEVAGDFMVQAQMTNLQSDAAFELYGQAPVIADEFRVDNAAIRFDFDGHNLTIQSWTDGATTPETQAFPITASDHHKLTVQRHVGELDISVDDKPVAKLDKGNLFQTGHVIFGADAGQDPNNKEWTLSHLYVKKTGNDDVNIVDTSNIKVPAVTDGLQSLAAKERPGFVVGASMAAGPMTDPQYVGVMGNFNGMTFENALKWQFTEPQPGVFTYQQADGMVDMARHSGIKTIDGHTPVFSEALPAWIRNLPTSTPEQKAYVQKVMVDHITSMATHFKGKISMYDVTNEIWDDNGNLRDNVFLRAMGEQYIDIAFDALHKVDPSAQLWLNMYGGETPGDVQDAMFTVTQRLLGRGVPVYGIGLQAHVYEAGDKISDTDLNNAINRFATLGIKTRISENDVYSDDGVSIQAAQYLTIFKTCLLNQNCVSYTTWGVSNRYDFFKDDDSSIQTGEDFLYDSNLQPTSAYSAIKNYLLTL